MTESRSIFGIFIFAGILLFAVWLGISIVTDQIETLMYVVAGGTLLTCAALGRKIWLIIPFMSAVKLNLMIPGQPSTLLLAQILFIGFCGLLFLMRRLPFKIQITELEFWMILLTLCVVQVYIRNPAGLNIFASSSVGGRPYALFGISLISSIILVFLRVNVTEIRWIIRLSILGGLMNLALSIIGFLIPRVGVWYGAADMNSMSQMGLQQGDYGIDRATRIGFLGTAAGNIARIVSSFKSPIRACFHPLWAPLILISLAFAALSGYRTEIVIVGLTYIVGIAYRGGAFSVIFSLISLIIGIVLLAIINIATPLPANIQRSLSFIPGTWDQAHIQDAEGSTEWRVDMWKEALLTDFWIKNKILGDGLGMTQEEFNFLSTFDENKVSREARRVKLSYQQEYMMASGSYHSGPVSTIRTIGYVGLAILILAQIRLAVHAHRQIKRARKTEWFPLTLFIGIPIICAPFLFIFVFGDFGIGISGFLMGAAMVRLLENNLPLPKYIRAKQSVAQIHSMGALSQNT